MFSHIRVHHGDSEVALPRILDELNEPCLFWLDAHYSGGFTGKGRLETPIINELNAIFEHHIKTHVVLIDDARCFNGEHDYPTLKQLQGFVLDRWPNVEFAVDADIIRIHSGSVTLKEPNFATISTPNAG